MMDEKNAFLKEGQISDDELDAVAGGGCSESSEKVYVGDRFQLDSASRCPSCGNNIATLVNIDERAMHGGSIKWYELECEACHSVFSTKSWGGSKL